MVTARARREYIEALMGRQGPRKQWPTLAQLQQSAPAPQRSAIQGGRTPSNTRTNAADSSMAQWMKSATSDTNPIGKILGPVLESNVTQNILKALGSTGAAVQPIFEQIARLPGSTGIVPNLMDPEIKTRRERQGKRFNPGEIPGAIGDNLYDLWNNDTTRGPVRTFSDVVDTAMGYTPEDVDNLSTGESWTRAGLGFIGDVATDPLSYVTGAGALKGARVGRQTVKQARETGTSLRDAFQFTNPDSIVRDRIRNTESWRRSRNPQSHRTAGRPLEEVTPEQSVPLTPEGGRLPGPEESTNARRSGAQNNINQDTPGSNSRELAPLTPDAIAEFIRAASAAGRANRVPRQAESIGELQVGPPELETALASALRKTDPANLPSRLIPFKWEAVEGPLTAAGASRAPEGLDALRASQSGPTGRLVPLSRSESSAWRRWMDREVEAGRLTKENREALMQARREKRPYEDMVALYDRISRGTNETLTSEAPRIAESMPTSPKAVSEAIDSVEVPVEQRYSTIIENAEKAIRDDLDTTVYDGVINSHLQEELSVLIKRQHKLDPDRPFQSNQGAARSSATKGQGRGEILDSWNSADGTIMFNKLRHDLLKRGLIDHVESRYTIPKRVLEDGTTTRQIRTIRVHAVRELGKVVGGADDALKAVGIQPSLGYGKSGYPIGFGEAYRILSEVDAESLARMTLDGVRGRQYGNSIGVPQSNIADAVEALMAAQHRAVLSGTKLSKTQAENLVYNELFKLERMTSKGKADEFTPKSHPLAHAGTDANIDKLIQRALNGLPGYEGLTFDNAVRKLMQSYAEAIAKAREPLYAQMAENAQRYGMERVMQTEKLRYEAIKQTVQTVETGPIRDVLDLIDGPRKPVDDLADELGVQPQVREIVEAEIVEELPEVIRPREFEALADTDRMVSAMRNMDRAARKARTSSWGKNQSREQRHWRNEAASAAAKKHQQVADDVAPYSAAMTAEEFEAAADLGIQSGFIAKLWGGIDRMHQWLNNNLAFYGGTGKMGNIMEGQTDFVRRFHESTRHSLNVAAKKYGQIIDEVSGETVFDSAFMAIRSGIQPTDELVREAMQEVQRLVDLVVETRQGNSSNVAGISIGNMSLREAGYAGERLARNFEAYPLVKGIFGDPQKPLSLDERAAFWRKDDFDLKARLEAYRKDKPQVQGLGTADFLDQLLSAHMTTMKESAIALESVRALKASGAWSSTPKSGYVAIHSLALDKRGAVMSYMPDTGFIRKEEWGQLLQVEKFLDELGKPAGKIRQRFNQSVFPLVDLWKSWKTILRPGHHVRNEIGDFSMAFMAGYLPSPGTLREAFDALKYGGNWQWTKSAQWTPEDALNTYARRNLGWEDTLDPSKTVGGERKIATIKLKGGRTVDLNAREFYAALQGENVLPMVQVREFLGDIQHSGTGVDPSAVNKLREKITLKPFRERGGLLRPYAVAVAEGRDHHIRIAHLLQFMKQEGRHFDNFEDLLSEAAAHVEKWHPTSKGTTPFERRNMNYAFAFYSWMRKAIPLTMEGIFLRPGRFLAIPKASYAFAESQGIEPHSIADPFPVDQMFPSFLTDRALGPQLGAAGEYMGFNPGIYNLDVLNTFAGTSVMDALQQDGMRGLWKAIPGTEGTLASLSPLIKTPYELLSGERLDTGIEISDKESHIDQVVPGFDLINTLTGVSPTKTVGQVPNAIGSSITGQPYNSDRTGWGPLQDTRAVSKGNANDANLRILNFILNMQGTDMSRQDYQNVAEIEMRNRLGAFRG